MSIKKQAFFIPAMMAGGFLYAQDADTIESKQLDEVVITANKTNQKQSSTGKVLTVINRETLERNTGKTLPQILNQQAGLIINGAENAPATNATVYLRGADRSHTLILIDGIPVNDASGISTEFDLNHFSIEQIERVEILKGSQSVTYGSDAIAGVINIITKKQDAKKPLGLNATAAAGTYGTLKGTAGVSGNNSIFQYSLQYSHNRSDGFSAAHDETRNQNFDKDGFRQNLVGFNLGASPTKKWKLRLSGQFDNYKADIDDAALKDDRNHHINNNNLLVAASSLYQFNKGTAHATVSFNNVRRKLNDEINVPAGVNDFDPFSGLYKSKVLFAEAYTNLNLHRHVAFVAGIDLRDQKADIETSFGKLGTDSLNATQYSGYATVLIKNLHNLNIELGGRYTHHSESGSQFSYSFNPSYLIHQQLKLFVNLSSGFRAPSLYNLASEYGNRNLKPEKSMSYEAGLQYISEANTLNIRGAWFKRSIEDIIIFESLAVPPYGRYANADKQNDHGFEIEATFKPSDRWNIVANYSYVNGEVTTASASGKDTSYFNLYRRPKNFANTTVGYQLSKRLYVSAGLKWIDKRLDVYSNPTTFMRELKDLSSYYNVDLYGEYKIGVFKIFADLRNITDQEYFDLYGYNSRRFNFMGGVAVSL